MNVEDANTMNAMDANAIMRAMGVNTMNAMNVAR
jgi:hypothetical protein